MDSFGNSGVFFGGISMLSLKTPELPKESTECILVTGKFNNIVQWRDEMQTAVSMLLNCDEKDDVLMLV